MKLLGIMSILFLVFATIALAVPVAEITADPTSGPAPLDVDFEATEDASAVEYAWDFGDGENTTGRVVGYTFDTEGVYTVTLTVTDNVSNTSTDTVDINVTTPLTGSSFEVSTTELDFGGSNQERDETLTKTVTITNTGATTLTDVALEESTSWDSDYKLAITPASYPSVTSGNSVDFQVSIFVPLDQDSGEKNLGKLNAVATAGTALAPKEIVVNLETESNLEITEIEYDITGGDSDDLSLSGDSDEIGDDVTLGDEIEITVVVENTFDENIDIEDVEVLIKDEDNELDFDEDKQDTSRIRDGDDDKFEFVFTVDDDRDIDDGDVFSFDIEARGDDENGARHKDIFTVEVEITREDDEVQIIDVRLVPSRVKCDNSVRLEVVIENTGLDDQNRAVVEVESSLLDLDTKDTNIEIDEGDDYTAKFTIDTRDLEPGVYPIDVFAGYKLGRTDDTDFIDLVVETCGEEEEEEEEEDDVPTLPPDFDDFPTGDVVYGESEGDDDGEPNYLVIALLALAVIVVIILIIILLVKATS